MFDSNPNDVYTTRILENVSLAKFFNQSLSEVKGLKVRERKYLLWYIYCYDRKLKQKQAEKSFR